MLFLEKHWKEKELRFFVLKTKEGLWIHYKGLSWFWKYQKELSPAKKPSKKKKELIQAHLPGRIQKIFVKEGERVEKGKNLLSLSAMKIEYSFQAEGEGVIEVLFCDEGEAVSLKQNLLKFKYKPNEIKQKKTKKKTSKKK